MKIAFIFIAFVLLTNSSCAVDEEVVKNQIGANTDRTVPTVQNADVRSNSAAIVKKEVDYFAHLQPEHREVLREWLKSKPHLRPAVEEIDSIFYENGQVISVRGSKFLRETVGEKGNQFYAVADLNRDGRQDFAALLFSSRRRSDVNYFGIAIFNAPFKKGQKPAYFKEIFRGIGNSYIVFDKMIENRLYLGKFESDFYCETFYPKGKTYYFKNCFD